MPLPTSATLAGRRPAVGQVHQARRVAPSPGRRRRCRRSRPRPAPRSSSTSTSTPERARRARAATSASSAGCRSRRRGVDQVAGQLHGAHDDLGAAHGGLQRRRRCRRRTTQDEPRDRRRGASPADAACGSGRRRTPRAARPRRPRGTSPRRRAGGEREGHRGGAGQRADRRAGRAAQHLGVVRASGRPGRARRRRPPAPVVAPSVASRVTSLGPAGRAEARAAPGAARRRGPPRRRRRPAPARGPSGPCATPTTTASTSSGGGGGGGQREGGHGGEDRRRGRHDPPRLRQSPAVSSRRSQTSDDRRVRRHGVPELGRVSSAATATVALCSSSATSGPTNVAPDAARRGLSTTGWPGPGSRRRYSAAPATAAEVVAALERTSSPAARACCSVSPTEAGLRVGEHDLRRPARSPRSARPVVRRSPAGARATMTSPHTRAWYLPMWVSRARPLTSPAA